MDSEQLLALKIEQLRDELPEGITMWEKHGQIIFPWWTSWDIVNIWLQCDENHFKAVNFTMKDSFEEVRTKILAAAQEMLK